MILKVFSHLNDSVILYEERLRAGTVERGEEEVRGGSYQCVEIPDGESKEDGTRLCLVLSSDRATVRVAQAAQRDCGVLCPWRFAKPDWMYPWETCSG